jgi:YesN/AraC family two-component response regulator
MEKEGALKILIAEDENHIRMMLKAIVSGLPPRLQAEVVAEVSNGREAVDVARLVKPDVVLMDINMPVLDGLQALEKIRESLPSTCVIMLTSMADMASVRKAVSLGASNYILKGTPPAEIQSMIVETWHEHSSV